MWVVFCSHQVKERQNSSNLFPGTSRDKKFRNCLISKKVFRVAISLLISSRFQTLFLFKQKITGIFSFVSKVICFIKEMHFCPGGEAQLWKGPCNLKPMTSWLLIGSVTKFSILMHAWPAVVKDRQERLKLKYNIWILSLFHRLGNIQLEELGCLVKCHCVLWNWEQCQVALRIFYSPLEWS